MKLCYIDTETSGLNASTDSLLQLACIIEIDGKVEEELLLNIKPFEYDSQDWDAGAVEKTGITKEIAASYTPPTEAFAILEKSLSKYIDKFDSKDKFFMVGYNIRFDEDFIRKFFIKNAVDENAKKYGNYFNSYFWYPSIDVTQLLVLRVMEQRTSFPNFKLETVCKKLGIDFNEKEAHNAMYDITKTRELWNKLRG